jgi:hypothetical protein
MQNITLQYIFHKIENFTSQRQNAGKNTKLQNIAVKKHSKNVYGPIYCKMKDVQQIVFKRKHRRILNISGAY